MPRILYTYCMTAVLLECVLDELVEQAGLPGAGGADDQELEQVVVRFIHTLQYTHLRCTAG